MDVLGFEGSSFNKLDEAMVALSKRLESVPTFNAVLLSCLKKALEKVAPGADASIFHINYHGNTKLPPTEPVGPLFHVLSDCLRLGRTASYDPKLYGVYDRPHSNDSRDVLAGISLVKLETLLADVCRKLPDYYVAALEAYWAETDAIKGAYSIPKKAILAQFQSTIFSSELERLFDEGGISRGELQRIQSEIRPGSRGNWYGIFVGNAGEAYREHRSMFALPLGAAIRDELIPGTDSTIVLYSPSRGIEKFASSAELHRALENRLTSRDTREQYLQTLTSNEQKLLPDSPEFRYLKVEADLFERFSESFISKSRDVITQSLAQLAEPDTDFESVVSAVELAQRVPVMLEQARLRRARLFQLMQKNIWQGELISKDASWPIEWARAVEAKQNLFDLINAIPTVEVIARQVLQRELERHHISIDVDNAYINTKDKVYEIDRRPSGTIAEVLIHCIDHNVQPNYLSGGGDGIFHMPDTYSDGMKVQGVSIFGVEDAIIKTLSDMGRSLRVALQKFWAAPAPSISSDAPMLTNKQAFQHAYVQVIAKELSLTVMAGHVEANLAIRFFELMNSEFGLGAHEIVLNPQPDYLTSFGPSFVINNELLDDLSIKGSSGYLVHTPTEGFEFTDTNGQMFDTLQNRLAQPGSEVKYRKSVSNVLAYCADEHLKGQLEAVSTILVNRADYDQSLSSVLQDNQNLSVMRYGIENRFYLLWAALKRTEWPDWLKVADSDIQQKYVELENSMDQYDVEYQRVFDTCFSLRDYVLRVFSEWSLRVMGEDLDAEEITVKSLYKMQVGGRTIEQEDTRTLLEFIIFGLHDDGHRAELHIENLPAGSALTVERLEGWLNNRNLRADYALALPSVPSPEFEQAYLDQQLSKMNHALFRARHSGMYSDSEAKLVERAMQGDASLRIQGVSIRNDKMPFKDVLVFSEANQRFYMFIRTPAGQYAFLKFAGFDALHKWLKSTMSADLDYAESLTGSPYVPGVAIRRGYNDGWRDTEFTDLGHAKGPLVSYMQAMYRAQWELHKSVAPAAYIHLGVAGRKRHARLNTQLKALMTVDTRENGFPTYDEFVYEEIKKNIEALLLSRGQRVEVDPDLIIVETDDFRGSFIAMLLEEQRLYADNPAYWKANGARYWTIGNHPNIDKLNIRDIASLSRTYYPGDLYIRMLRTEFLDRRHPDFEFKRAAHASKIRCEMHYNALSQFIDGELSPDTLKSLQRIIDSLADDASPDPDRSQSNDPAEGMYKFNLYALDTFISYDRIVGGVYIFRIKTREGFADWLYTPDAPDRRSFRPVSKFYSSVRYDGLANYYASRVKVADKKVVNDMFTKFHATVNPPQPIKPWHRDAVVNLYGVYEEKVWCVVSDIEETTTNYSEVVTKIVYDTLQLAAAVVCPAVPAVGLAATAAGVLKSLYGAAHAEKRGNYDTALGHVKDALIGLATLGKAGAAKGAAKQVTNAQISFLALAKSARSAAQFVGGAVGQNTGDKALIDFFKELLKEKPAGSSKTTVH
ncbi:hypothetical protein C1893_18525 [Pseudomonas sp. MPR-ANC1]|uniref:dermonecrotic toxin domain-containing protein n=1 Tax=Pseudomonas sp. MPR-ANC1 TaxID=2075548 RepID=UPI000CD1BC35|nr:DUF6543 domain-containing protein [Pseudomonas sp. MPR-ANC1]POA46732.1 hypothetical protein C1893_18525 [Pseudomonas sp. MPR-ANC1]